MLAKDVLMRKKSLFKSIEKASSNSVTFVFSTKDVDRDGDRVMQDWDLDDFNKNPIALAFHDHKQPIGVWENIRVEAGKLLGDLKLASRGTSQFIDTLHNLVEQKILKAVSVGFRSGKYEPNDFGGYDLSENSLFECSLVSVPANQNALRKAFDYLPDGEIDKLCSVQGNCSKSQAEGLSTTKRASNGSNQKTIYKGSNMTLKERIEAKQNELVAAYNELRNREFARLYPSAILSYIEADRKYSDPRTSSSEKEALKPKLDAVKALFPQKLSEAEPSKTN